MKASELPQTVKAGLEASPDAVAFVAWLVQRYPTNADPSKDSAVAELHEVGRLVRGAIHGFIAKHHPGALQHEDPFHRGLVRSYLLAQAIAMYEAQGNEGQDPEAISPLLPGLLDLVDRLDPAESEAAR